jgi:biotin carboxyl carrier protein
MILQLEIHGELRRIELTPDKLPNRFRVALNDGAEQEIEARLLRPGVLSLQIAGKTCRCVLEEGPEGTVIHFAGSRFPYQMDDPRSLKSRRSRTGGHDGPKPVSAPMPGRVVRVLVQKGDEVQAQQGIIVIEAMKMQNELKSPKAGKIAGLRVQPGGTVAAGEVLAVVE